jgi:surface carbohydrate biosynthesis protein
MIIETPLPWAFLPVEVKARELHSRVLLGAALAERGFGVVVGRKGNLEAVADRLPRGVFVAKSCERYLRPGIEYRNRLGHVITCLDEEGFVYASAEDYASRRLDDGTLSQLRHFFAWGADQADVVREFHPRHARLLSITGNPRVDLWRPELRPLYAPAADALREEHGEFVLLASAFAHVINAKGDDFVLEAARGAGRFTTQEGERQFHAYLEHSRVLLAALTEAVPRLADALPPGTKIVVRPHPSEDLHHWLPLARHPRVEVVREGSVTPWLLASTALVHSNCTTGVEALLLGQPAIAYAPREDPRYDMNVPNEVSHVARTEDELRDLVLAVLGRGGLPPSAENRAALEHHVAALDGPFAFDRIADVLAQAPPRPAPLGDGALRRIGGLARTAPYRVARRLRSGAAVPSVGPGAASKFPGGQTTETHIKEIVTSAADVLGRFRGIECVEYDTDLFALVPPGVAA